MSDRVEMVADQEDAEKAVAVDSTEAEVVAPMEEATKVVAPVATEESSMQGAVAQNPLVEQEPQALEVVAETAEMAAPTSESVSEQSVSAVETAKPVAAQEGTAELDANRQEQPGGGGAGDGNRKVRVLSVGQRIEGTVKRIADFGAFVDIGVGRDGLIHVSELSVRRVGKVTDVLSEGQPVTAWIKKLDRERNRISLTLIDPNTKTIRDLEQGEIVKGTVSRIMPYGAFIDIGIGRDALLHVREMSEGYVAKPEDVVKVGDEIEARIIELSRRRGRVDLSLKGLRPEPEPAQQPVVPPSPPRQQESGRRQPRREPEPEPEPEEIDEGIEALSPMELAFKRAMEAGGMEYKANRKKQGKRNRRERDDEMLDDIITRTLSSGRK